jgi:hypothetical protein
VLLIPIGRNVLNLDVRDPRDYPKRPLVKIGIYLTFCLPIIPVMMIGSYSENGFPAFHWLIDPIIIISIAYIWWTFMKWAEKRDEYGNKIIRDDEPIGTNMGAVMKRYRVSETNLSDEEE